ncbi:MAG: 3-hydroxybutyryl-CoA dehydrogenase [Ignavibacteriae bacterium]|nr:3-hydroxybutyryl-CoA dehydrogenase [Ignavibacteriota bacterium]
MPSSRQSIYLIGDFMLVEEFGEMCHAKDVRILYRLNSKNSQKPLPAYFKQQSSPPRNASIVVELTNSDSTVKKKNLHLLEKSIPRTTPILSSSVTTTVTEQSTWLKHSDRLVGISGFPTLISQKLCEIAPSIHTKRETITKASEFFFTLGKQVAIVQDRIGMVMPRILCMLINEAVFALMENIASPRDIDTAMKLGTNYPSGPIEWADRIGVKNVCDVLMALQGDLHEERYRISPLLQVMATGQQWWHT